MTKILQRHALDPTDRRHIANLRDLLKPTDEVEDRESEDDEDEEPEEEEEDTVSNASSTK